MHHKTYIACYFFTVDGAWSIWSNWGDCSLTCGDDGSRDRQRSCSAPAPQFGGSECIGNNTETGSCEDTPCASKIIQQDMTLFFFPTFFFKDGLYLRKCETYFFVHL